jgi:hemolysin activation/secretion protein
MPMTSLLSTPRQPLRAFVLALLASGLTCGVSTQAQAQSVAAAAPAPNAGDVLRDLPAPKPTLPTLSDTPAAPGQAAATPVVSQRFTFNRLVVEGVTALAPFQVQLVADPFVNKPMGEDELAALLQALRRRLDLAGMSLAGIGIPSLDMVAGVVTVPVVEPRLGHISVPQGADNPVTEARVKGLMSWFNLGEGRTLDIDALERVMFALNDMPGVQAKAKLTPSGDEGIYNLSITSTARRAWDAAVSLDNQGLGPIGRWRLGASARLNNPFGIGDNLDVQALSTNTRGVKLGRVAYELPVGYTPVRMAVAASRVAYKLGGEFDELGASGSANVFEGSLSYPLLRARSRTLLARVGIDDKHFADRIDFDDSDGRRRIRTAVLSLSWESRDTFGGGGYWGAGFTQRFGHLKLGTDAQIAQDASLGEQGVAGRFAKRELQLSRLQNLGADFSLFASVSNQSASRNLDGAEKVGLGGTKGVRAYAASESPSDDATIVNTELRYWVNPSWTVFALSDWARGRLQHEPAVTSTTPNTVSLRGSGLGLSASIPEWANVRATLAWRGNQAGTAESTDRKPRLALQAQHSF